TTGAESTAAIQAKQVAQQDAERARFIVERAIQEKKSTVIRALGVSKSAELVGEAIKNNPDPVPSPPASITERQTSSSHYASAAEDESDLSSEPKRMSLGPSGTSMLEARSKIQRRNQPTSWQVRQEKVRS
ncbi:Prohibitin-2, partial [Phytophthora palmivora]